MNNDLRKREVNGGQVVGSLEEGYQLFVPELSENRYCLAQVDDYMHLPRRKFAHKPPMKLQLDARVSADTMLGTWGFGLWNDPFSLGFGTGGRSRLIPVPPNAAWFFYASDENHLALRNDHPGAGFHVKTYRSPLIPPVASLLALPGLPFLLWRAAARMIRRLSRWIVREDTCLLDISVRDWHTYGIQWEKDQVIFEIDGDVVYQTKIAPQGRLGLVIWIDNQFFRFDPTGRLGFGYLKTPNEIILPIRRINIET